MEARAFDDVVRTLTPALRAYVASRVPAHSVEDVLQETLSSLWASEPLLPETDRERRRLRAKAYRIADRRAADMWRAVSRDQRRMLRVATTIDRADHPSALDDYLHRQEPAWLHELPVEALEVLLPFAQGVPVGQIADELGISPNAVSSRLKRVRAKVRQVMDESEVSER